MPTVYKNNDPCINNPKKHIGQQQNFLEMLCLFFITISSQLKSQQGIFYELNNIKQNTVLFGSVRLHIKFIAQNKVSDNINDKRPLVCPLTELKMFWRRLKGIEAQRFYAHVHVFNYTHSSVCFNSVKTDFVTKQSKLIKSEKVQYTNLPQIILLIILKHTKKEN